MGETKLLFKHMQLQTQS